MAAAGAYRLPLSPGNRESTSCSALDKSPESVLDLDLFESRKTATITSPTTFSFDTLAVVGVPDPRAQASEPVSPRLNMPLTPREKFDDMAEDPLDELVALVKKYGCVRGDDQPVPVDDDDNVVAELEALIRPAKKQTALHRAGWVAEQARDPVFLRVKTITSAIPTHAHLILNPPPEPEVGPELTYVVDEDRIQGYDFKCYYQDSNPDPASSFTVFRMTIYEEVLDGGGGGGGADDDEDIGEGPWSEDERETYLCTLLPCDHADQPRGPSEFMDVLLIVPPIGVLCDKPWNNEEETLRSARAWYLGKSFDSEKLLRRVGYDRFFDGGLIWKGATGFEFMFQRRLLVDIIKGLRDNGMRQGADYLENSALKPQRELEGRIQKVLKEERWAAFGRVVDLVLRLNPDKNPPTISLDETFVELLERRYLGRWWASCRDDLGLDDRAVYMPEGDIKKKRSGGRGQSRGGYARRHGRPPDPINPAPNAPPSRTPPPATTTLCPPGADEGVAGPVDVLKDLPRNPFFALSGLSAAGNASPPTAKSGIPKSSELSVSNPANLSS